MRIETFLARLAVFAALGAGGLERSSHGAVDVFLKLSGIDGESVHVAHQGSSDVMSWSWGAIIGEKIIGEKRPAAFSEMTVRKAIDKATPLIAKGLAKGTHFPQGIITLRTQSRTQVDFARIVMEDVNITGILIGMSVASEVHSETIALSYKRIGVEYFTIEANERSAFEWDVANNREGGVTFPGEVADADGDGMADDWERKFNLDPQVNDAGLDRDQDGATNGEEYMAGTSPIDPNRVFRSTLSYIPGQRSATLSWQSAPDKTYRILNTQTLGTPFGGDLIVPSAGEGTTSVTLPANALNQFYRVELVVPQ